jgi:hypothetical protein
MPLGCRGCETGKKDAGHSRLLPSPPAMAIFVFATIVQKTVHFSMLSVATCCELESALGFSAGLPGRRRRYVRATIADDKSNTWKVFVIP